MNQFLTSTDGTTQRVTTEWDQGSWSPAENWGTSIDDYKNITSVYIVDSFLSQPA